MKTIEKSILLGLIITILINATCFTKQCDNIEKKVVRLHILANSDSNDDQTLKLKVRDKVLEYSKDIVSNIKNKDEAEIIMNNNLENINLVAQQEIYNQGYNYPCKVEMTNMYFNTREYNSVTLPAGNYDALRILIGEGKGHNWWCVMFPPMCLPAAQEKEELEDVLTKSQMSIVEGNNKYEIRFKFIEIFKKIKDVLSEYIDLAVSKNEEVNKLELDFINETELRAHNNYEPLK